MSRPRLFVEETAVKGLFAVRMADEFATQQTGTWEDILELAQAIIAEQKRREGAQPRRTAHG